MWQDPDFTCKVFANKPLLSEKAGLYTEMKGRNVYVSDPRGRESLLLFDCGTDVPGELVGGNVDSDYTTKIGVRGDEDRPCYDQH